jgi:hypothetical protein
MDFCVALLHEKNIKGKRNVRRILARFMGKNLDETIKLNKFTIPLGIIIGLMRKAFLLFVFLFLYGIHFQGYAQTSGGGVLPPGSKPPSLRERYMQNNREYEIGISIGNTYGLHDISGDPGRTIRLFIWDTQWELINLHFGVFGRYRHSQSFAVKTALNYGKISGSYVFYAPGTRQHDLGYSFQNHLLEWSVYPEIYLPRFIQDVSFDIYGFMGLAVFYHNPVVGSQGEVPFPGSLRNIELAIPLGAGFVYTFTNHYRLGGSIGWRKTFTDYLDGYKSGKGMDSYFFVALNISYLFETWKNRPVLFD